MAKKQPSDTFVMAAAIRELLRSEPKLRASEVYERLTKAYPHETINENSCKVAYSNQRKALGLAKGRRGRRVRRARPAVAARTRSTKVFPLELLQSARKFIVSAGSAENAVAAIQQVASLQVK